MLEGNFTLLQQTNSLAEKKNILSRLFGETVVEKALETIGKNIASPENAHNLRITDKGKLTTIALANSIAVPKHTFYGN